jgi:hypothetical protein
MSPAEIRAWWRRHAAGQSAFAVLFELEAAYAALQARPAWWRRLLLIARARRLWRLHRQHMAVVLADPAKKKETK